MEVHDLVVIGSGPAGDTAALYAQRAGIQTLVLEKAAFGGQVSLTSKIDNYPGAISDGDRPVDEVYADVKDLLSL